MTEQENSFTIANQEQIEKAQNIITMIKEQEEFSEEEADEIISFIHNKLGFSQSE